MSQNKSENPNLLIVASRSTKRINIQINYQTIRRITDLIRVILETLRIDLICDICEYFGIELKYIINVIMRSPVVVTVNKLYICLHELYKRTGALPTFVPYIFARKYANIPHSDMSRGGLQIMSAYHADTKEQIELGPELNTEQQLFSDIVNKSFMFRCKCEYNKDIHYKICEITIAFMSLTVKDDLLPPYIILWILDWFIDEYPHYKKIQLIQGIYSFKQKLIKS